MLSLSMAASAQDLDPTVVVDRVYEGKLMEVHKPVLEMAVPDTVMHFDLDFDYSVFESPYKGSYEFNPYLLSMKPSAAADESGRFYLKAGAGYQLHPTLDLVWSPELPSMDDSFHMDVYARNRSYVGSYWNMEADDDDVIDRGESVWNGYDFDSKVGVGLGYDSASGYIDGGVSYFGIHQKDMEWKRGYNGIEADFEVASRNSSSRLTYSVKGFYRFAGDRSVSLSDDSNASLNETTFDAEAMAGLQIGGIGKAVVDFGLRLDGYSGGIENAASELFLVPHFIYEKGALKADLGIRFAGVVTDTLAGGFSMPARNQIVYPDISVKLKVIPDALALLLKAGGGPEVHSYHSLLERNRHLNPLMWENSWFSGFGLRQEMGVSIERISLTAGLEGRIGSRFSWNLNGGYVNYAAGILDAVAVLQSYSSDGLIAGIEYRPYDKTFVEFSWLWKSGDFMADGWVAYTDAYGMAFEDSIYCLKPSELTGNVSFEYNFRKRIFAGADCSFATKRTGGTYSAVLPGYADLGVSLEYSATRRLSVWARGGNLLGMTIQRNPLYAEKGVYFTAGICLKF